MTAQTITIGSQVNVRSLVGTETGEVIGIQTDPATGRIGWLRVRFADGTNSSWPINVCTAA